MVDGSADIVDVNVREGQRRRRVKRAGKGWRSLELSALLAPAGSLQPLKLTKEAFVAFARKIMAKL